MYLHGSLAPAFGEEWLKVSGTEERSLAPAGGTEINVKYGAGQVHLLHPSNQVTIFRHEVFFLALV